jgi:hypothetical protein
MRARALLTAGCDRSSRLGGAADRAFGEHRIEDRQQVEVEV